MKKAISAHLYLMFLLALPGFVLANTCEDALSKSQKKVTVEELLAKKSYLRPYDNPVLDDQMIALSVHTSSSFDHKSTTKAVAIALNQLVRSPQMDLRSISIVEKISSAGIARNHYLSSNEIDLPIYSQHGAHSLKFSNLKLVILSGGYLEICLKNATRDLLIGSLKSIKMLDLYLVVDAIYVSDIFMGPLDKNMESKFKKVGASKYSQFPLKEAMRFMTGKNLVSYLRNVFIDVQNERIKIGSLSLEKKYTRQGVTLKFFNNKKLLATFGSGGKIINVRLTDLSAVSNGSFLF